VNKRSPLQSCPGSLCYVLGKTLSSHSVTLHKGVKTAKAKREIKAGKISSMDLQPSAGVGREERNNTPSHFKLRKLHRTDFCVSI